MGPFGLLDRRGLLTIILAGWHGPRLSESPWSLDLSNKTSRLNCLDRDNTLLVLSLPSPWTLSTIRLSVISSYSILVTPSVFLRLSEFRILLGALEADLYSFDKDCAALALSVRCGKII